MLARSKRFADVVIGSTLLAFGCVFALPGALLVYLEDRRSPLYRATRIGKGGTPFVMYKLRTMQVGADKNGVFSTSGDDPRITRVGQILRRFKIDELPQLLNVIQGSMSLVGPRPNVSADVDKYSDVERRLLDVRPGITDLASVVFSDESDILRGSVDPDKAYDSLIRPYKSRMALLTVTNQSLNVYVRILGVTGLSLFSRRTALRHASSLVLELSGDVNLADVATRMRPLVPGTPP